MKASKTGIIILLFVLMSIILMVAFGGKPFQPGPSPETGQVVKEDMVLRKFGPASTDNPFAPKIDFTQTNQTDRTATNPADAPHQKEEPKQAIRSPLIVTAPQLGKPDLGAPASKPKLQSPIASEAGAALSEVPPSRTPSRQTPWAATSPSPSSTAFRPVERTPDQAIQRRGQPRQTPAPSFKPPKDQVRQHRIVDGDTLQSLSEKYLGTSDRYLEIFAANRGVLQQPDLLPLGVRLAIPPRVTPKFVDGVGPLTPDDLSRNEPSLSAPPIPTTSPQPWSSVGGDANSDSIQLSPVPKAK